MIHNTGTHHVQIISVLRQFELIYLLASFMSFDMAEAETIFCRATIPYNTVLFNSSHNYMM
jgi:hypothetical protein